MMGLQGGAAIAMWWNVASTDRAEFHDWHSNEHLPERMSIPGFRRGSRWEAEEGQGMFVLYELEDYATLTSPGYLGRLNDPTPWSQKMMPRHHDMVRSQCRIAASNGGGVARLMTTIRLSPRSGREVELTAFLADRLTNLSHAPDVTGAHLLRTETPDAPQTREQQIRGKDAVADWIILVSGFGHAPGQAGEELVREVQGQGAGELSQQQTFRLVHAMTPGDIAGRLA